MKKFTIALALFASIGFTTVAQDLIQTTVTSTSSRSGQTSVNNLTQGVLSKNGGAAAVNVAFTDDFSQPNDRWRSRSLENSAAAWGPRHP